MRLALRAAPLLLLLPLAACAETHTIRQLGHPEFEAYVGADTRLEKVDEPSPRSLDAFPATASDSVDHGFRMRVVPWGTEDEVYLYVQAVPKERRLKLRRLAVAAYGLSEEQARAFERTGALPDPTAAFAHYESQEPPDEAGALELGFKYPRSAIPPGTERLAMPILTQFEDGWINIYFHQTIIPSATPPPGEPGPPGEGDEGDEAAPQPPPSDGR